MKGEPILRTQSLGRSLDGRAIVADVTLEARCGEILAIMGASGAGKSSLLRLLNRLDEPTAGAVFLKDADARTLAPTELRRRVGMVLQTPWLFPGSVADNVAFGPAQRGVAMSADEIAALLAEVRLDGFAQRDAGRLSGGEAQRVSVARTLANRPQVLLLDEPTSALDPDARAGVEELIARIVRDEDLACIMVTHDAGQAERLASRVVRMSGGRVHSIEDVVRVAGAAL